MAVSKMHIGPNLAHALTTRYGIANPTFVESIAVGYSADNFIISDAGRRKLFVKRYNPKRSRERLLEIHAAERYFYANGIPAIAPIEDIDGETLFECDGCWYALFPFVAGDQFETLPSIEAARSMGESLAKLHIAGARPEAPYSSKHPEEWDTEAFRREAGAILAAMNAIATPSSFDIQAREFIELKTMLVERGQTDYISLNFSDEILLHGDFHYHNIFFTAAGQVTHIFDFERVMRGPRATELAYGLLFNCFDTHSEQTNDVSAAHFNRAAAYLQAYDNIFPITNEEIAAGIRWFYLAQMVHQLWVERLHYIEHNMRADSLLPKRLNRLRYFSSDLEGIIAKVVGSI